MSTSRTRPFYQAMKVGQLEAVGLDWKLANAYVDRINAVTAGQVQAVAKKVPGGRTPDDCRA